MPSGLRVLFVGAVVDGMRGREKTGVDEPGIERILRTSAADAPAMVLSLSSLLKSKRFSVCCSRYNVGKK